MYLRILFVISVVLFFASEGFACYAIFVDHDNEETICDTLTYPFLQLAGTLLVLCFTFLGCLVSKEIRN